MWYLLSPLLLETDDTIHHSRQQLLSRADAALHQLRRLGH